MSGGGIRTFTGLPSDADRAAEEAAVAAKAANANPESVEAEPDPGVPILDAAEESELAAFADAHPELASKLNQKPATESDALANIELLRELKSGADAKQDLASAFEAQAIEYSHNRAIEAVEEGDPEQVYEAMDGLANTAGLGSYELGELFTQWSEYDPDSANLWLTNTGAQLQRQAFAQQYQQQQAQQQEYAKHYEEGRQKAEEAVAGYVEGHPDAEKYGQNVAQLLSEFGGVVGPVVASDPERLGELLETTHAVVRETDKEAVGSEAWAQAQADSILNVGQTVRPQESISQARARWADAGYAMDNKGRVSKIPDEAAIEQRVNAARESYGKPKEGTPEWETAEAARLNRVFARPDMRSGKSSAPKESAEMHPAHPNAPKPESRDWYAEYLSGDYSGK